VDRLQVFGDAGAHYHPGQSGTLRLGPKAILARFGVIHPVTAKAFDVDGAVVGCEVYIDAVPAKRATTGFMRPAFAPPALQPVTRDFAFLVRDDVASDSLLRAVRSADKALISAVRVFDRFMGAGVPEGSVSLALEVTLQPQDKSFTEAELKAVSDRIVTSAAKLGASLRG